MKIDQIYTGCLAQGAYYISSKGEAAIIDPLREVDTYIERAKADGVKIKYILETHFHADFVSGHLDLARKTGAQIVYGPTAKPSFEAYIAKDEEILELGDLKIKVLHTPGHTMESSTFLLLDQSDKEYAIFSGDTLFLGDVGRPDLAQKAVDMTQEELAGLLFDSLREKIMILPDEVVVYPGHGAGSACGKNMMKETVDTLGHQKEVNYALRANMTKEEFIKEVTEGLAPPPLYFPENVRMNREGYESIDTVLEHGVQPLMPDVFEAIASEVSALVLDTRTPDLYAKQHIPKSINIGLDGNFAPWVGALIKDIRQPILLVTEEGREVEAVTRLARIGYDNTIGYLSGGLKGWLESDRKTDAVKEVVPSELEKVLKQNDIVIIDVRNQGEFEAEHIINAKNLPLNIINEHMDNFKYDNDIFIHCAGGYRSMIAISILKARGIHNLINVKEGFKGIKTTSISVTNYVCPSTLKN